MCMNYAVNEIIKQSVLYPQIGYEFRIYNRYDCVFAHIFILAEGENNNAIFRIRRDNEPWSAPIETDDLSADLVWFGLTFPDLYFHNLPKRFQNWFIDSYNNMTGFPIRP